ncbi:hypothetical protein HDU98_003675 [Podochytrium sp. JEL0797]|nr:hypothetical protein HDU98_003675 [Podochytrium sp. JEL0797]
MGNFNAPSAKGKGPASASDLSNPATTPSTLATPPGVRVSDRESAKPSASPTATGAVPVKNPIAASSNSFTKPTLPALSNLAWGKLGSSTGTRVWNPIAGSFDPSRPSYSPSEISGGSKPIPQEPHATAMPKASRTDSGSANPPMRPAATSSTPKQTNPSPPVASLSRSVDGAKSTPQTFAAAAPSSSQPAPTSTSSPTMSNESPRAFVVNDYAKCLTNAEELIRDLKKDLPHIREALASNKQLEVENAEVEAFASDVIQENSRLEKELRASKRAADKRAKEMLQNEEKNSSLARENALLKKQLMAVNSELSEIRASNESLKDLKEMIANYSAIQELGTKRAKPDSGHDESGPSPSKRAPLSHPKPAAPSVDRAVRFQTSDDVVYVRADDE